MGAIPFEIPTVNTPVNNYVPPSTTPKVRPNINPNITFSSPTSTAIGASLARLSLPAMLTYSAVDYLSDTALGMYQDLEKEHPEYFKPTAEAPTPSPLPNPTPEPPPSGDDIPEPLEPIPPIEPPAFEGTTLIKVLGESNVATHEIAKQINLSNLSTQAQDSVVAKSLGILGNAIIESSNIQSAQLFELSNSVKAMTTLMASRNEIDVAYRDLELQNSMSRTDSLHAIAQALLNGNDIQAVMVETVSGVSTAVSESPSVSTEALGEIANNLKKSEDEIALTKQQLSNETYDATSIATDNLGDAIPNASPRQMRAIKNSVVAKKNSDENTFEVDDFDIDNMFGAMPDISSIFHFVKKSERLEEIASGI